MRLAKIEKFVLVVTLSFFVIAVFARSYPYFTFDLFITQSLQQVDFPLFSSLMIWLSRLGDVVWGSLIILLISGLFLLFKKRKEALIILVSSLGLAIFGLIIKAVIARPRPDVSLVNQIGEFTKTDSFPSGHVLLFLGLYGVLILIVSKGENSLTKYLVFITLFTLIILIGVSRVYLGAHWFSDVIGAYLLGFLWLFMISRLFFKVRSS